MECDEHGNVWVTGPGGVWVLTPDGEHLGTVATPEVCGSIAWGGDDLRSLFLMTSTTVHVVRTLVGPPPLPGRHDDEIRLYMFDGGITHLPLRNFTFGKGGGGEMITTPTPYFVITHPRGNAVIDGGNPPEVAVDAGKHWGPITEMSTPVMTPEQALLPSLERVGIDPASIRWVVQTHLHLDHTGAVAVIDRLPNAEVLVTRTEHEFAHAPDPLARISYVLADYAKPGVPVGAARGLRGRLRRLRRRHADRLALARALPRPHVVRGQPAERRDLPAVRRRGQRARPLGERRAPRVHGLGVRHGALAEPAAAARLAARRDVVTGHDPGLWDDFKQAPEFYS